MFYVIYYRLLSVKQRKPLLIFPALPPYNVAKIIRLQVVKVSDW